MLYQHVKTGARVKVVSEWDDGDGLMIEDQVDDDDDDDRDDGDDDDDDDDDDGDDDDDDDDKKLFR